MATSRREVRKSLRTNFDPGLKFRYQRVLLRGQQALHVPGLVAGGRLSEPVFVVSAPRSGSHLLYVTLRASGRFAHWRPSEAHEVWEADYHPALRGWESNAVSPSELTPEAAARIRRTFFLVAGSRKRLLDKTPRNALRVPFVDAVFPDARYVYLQRDGRDNVNSLINAWRSPRYRTYELPEPHSIPGADPRWWKFVLYPGWREDATGPLEVVCARQWTIPNQYLLRARAATGADRWMTVRYEDLIDRPVEEVGRIMEWLGLPYEKAVADKAAAMSTNLINVVTPPARGKWRRENPKEIEAILPVIAPTMEVMRYRLDDD